MSDVVFANQSGVIAIRIDNPIKDSIRARSPSDEHCSDFADGIPDVRNLVHGRIRGKAVERVSHLAAPSVSSLYPELKAAEIDRVTLHVRPIG